MGKFVIKQGTGYSFSLLAGNGQVIAVSQSYKGLPACKNGIESVRKNADSPVVKAE